MALVNSTTDTLKKTRLRERTDRARFSRPVRHPASKWCGSILLTPEPARGINIQWPVVERAFKLYGGDEYSRRDLLYDWTMWTTTLLLDVGGRRRRQRADSAVESRFWVSQQASGSQHVLILYAIYTDGMRHCNWVLHGDKTGWKGKVYTPAL